MRLVTAKELGQHGIKGKVALITAEDKELLSLIMRRTFEENAPTYRKTASSYAFGAEETGLVGIKTGDKGEADAVMVKDDSLIVFEDARTAKERQTANDQIELAQEYIKDKHPYGIMIDGSHVYPAPRSVYKTDGVDLAKGAMLKPQNDLRVLIPVEEIVKEGGIKQRYPDWNGTHVALPPPQSWGKDSKPEIVRTDGFLCMRAKEIQSLRDRFNGTLDQLMAGEIIKENGSKQTTGALIPTIYPLDRGAFVRQGWALSENSL